MKAKFLYCLGDFPELDEYYKNKYGCGYFIALKALDDSLCKNKRHPINCNDIVICNFNCKPTEKIFDISEDFKVGNIGFVASISRDMRL